MKRSLSVLVLSLSCSVAVACGGSDARNADGGGHAPDSGGPVASGDSGATGRDGGVTSAGDSGTTSAGDSGTTSAGDSGTTSTGDMDGGSAGAACSFNGETVADGANVTAYQSSSVPYGSTCTSEQRTCTDGALSGSYAYASCSVEPGASCTLSGQVVADGSSYTFFLSPRVPYGASCSTIAQSRTCTDGTLSGSDTYNYVSCTAAPTTQPPSAPTEAIAPGTGANPLTDFLIQDVCLNSAGRPIPGDPATCADHRDLEFGEFIPYALTDNIAAWGNVPAGMDTHFPIEDPDGFFYALDGANNGGWNWGYRDWDNASEVVDVLESNGLYTSSIGTGPGPGDGPYDGSQWQEWYDGGCGHDDAWMLFPMTSIPDGPALQQSGMAQPGQPTIVINGRTGGANAYSGCPSGYSDGQTIVQRGSYTYSSGKTLDTIVEYGYQTDSSHTNIVSGTHIEETFYTREYGSSQWISWWWSRPAPSDLGNNCASIPDDATITLMGHTFYLLYCSDRTYYRGALPLSYNPLTNIYGADEVLSKNLLSEGDFAESAIGNWTAWSNTDFSGGRDSTLLPDIPGLSAGFGYSDYLNFACWHSDAECAGASMYQDVDTSSLSGNLTLRYGAILKMDDPSQAADAVIQLFMYGADGSVVDTPPGINAHVDGGFWRHYDGTVNWDFSAVPVSRIRFQVYIEKSNVDYRLDEAYLTPSR